MNEPQREMPRYKCHKIVHALLIQAIVFDSDLARAAGRETDGTARITPAEEGFAPFKVGADYLRRHKPEVGGYYVVYEDGYISYSPAEPFESGYSAMVPESASGALTGPWDKYKRKGLSEMRPYVKGEDMTNICISPEDDPENDMGMVARNPKNSNDQWYVARAYFDDNLEPAETF